MLAAHLFDLGAVPHARKPAAAGAPLGFAMLLKAGAGIDTPVTLAHVAGPGRRYQSTRGTEDRTAYAEKSHPSVSECSESLPQELLSAPNSAQKMSSVSAPLGSARQGAFAEELGDAPISVPGRFNHANTRIAGKSPAHSAASPLPGETQRPSSSVEAHATQPASGCCKVSSPDLWTQQLVPADPQAMAPPNSISVPANPVPESLGDIELAHREFDSEILSTVKISVGDRSTSATSPDTAPALSQLRASPQENVSSVPAQTGLPTLRPLTATSRVQGQQTSPPEIEKRPSEAKQGLPETKSVRVPATLRGIAKDEPTGPPAQPDDADSSVQDSDPQRDNLPIVNSATTDALLVTIPVHSQISAAHAGGKASHALVEVLAFPQPSDSPLSSGNRMAQMSAVSPVEVHSQPSFAESPNTQEPPLLRNVAHQENSGVARENEAAPTRQETNPDAPSDKPVSPARHFSAAASSHPERQPAESLGSDGVASPNNSARVMPSVLATEPAHLESTAPPSIKEVPAASPPEKNSSAWRTPSATTPHAELPPTDSAELRVNLRTQELGRIEVHTAVHNSQVTTSVAVEDAGARTAVVNEFNKLHIALGAHQLQLETASVTLAPNRSSGMNTDGGSPQGFSQERRTPTSPPLKSDQETEAQRDEEGSLDVLV